MSKNNIVEYMGKTDAWVKSREKLMNEEPLRTLALARNMDNEIVLSLDVVPADQNAGTDKAEMATFLMLEDPESISAVLCGNVDEFNTHYDQLLSEVYG